MENNQQKEILKQDINKIINKTMCHNHMALKGKSIEWLEKELQYLKKVFL